jgi:hypothetical protein
MEDYIKKLSNTEIPRELPILEYYKDLYDSCFIVFHPFYEKIFVDEFNYLDNYKICYPLIKRIAWQDILKRTEVASAEKLVLAITYSASNEYYQKQVEDENTRLQSFYKFCNILEPVWQEDKIPEDIIVRFVNFLIKKGYSEINIADLSFADGKIEQIIISNDGIFNYLGRKRITLIYTSDQKFCLKLPDNDMPFTLFLGNGFSLKSSLNELDFEGFYADSETKITWYIDRLEAESF